VAALAAYDDLEGVGAGQHRPGSRGDVPGRDIRRDVDCKGPVDAVEHTFVDHDLRPAKALFARLEHETDPPRYLAAIVGEDLGRAEQHCGVGIMSAGVRTVGMCRFECLFGVLWHRESIGIGTKQQGGARAGALEIGDHRCCGIAGRNVEPQAIEGTEDSLLGVGVVEPDLGVCVDVATHLGDLFEKPFRGMEDVDFFGHLAMLTHRVVTRCAHDLGQTVLMGTGRYAPSPTGDLHLGNLRTAIVAWLFARSTERRFVLRFEDLDRDAIVEDAYGSQRSDLEALGIDFDGEALSQRSRMAEYTAVIAGLVDRDLTYPCWCSRREIREAVAAPNAPVVAGQYPGTCERLSSAERAERVESGKPPALRLRAGGASYSFTDAIVGEVAGAADDFVIRRGDGTPAYNLVVVVDDAFQAVDQVVRGDDLVTSTPRHLHVASLLGLPVPSYAHVPLVMSTAGERLAKRDGAVTLRDRVALGESVAQVRSTLAVSLGLAEAGESPSMDELLNRFDPVRLPRQPFVYSPEGPDPKSADNESGETSATDSSARNDSP
jgi:glutamyl-tRNA synthetase